MKMSDLRVGIKIKDIWKFFINWLKVKVNVNLFNNFGFLFIDDNGKIDLV